MLPASLLPTLTIPIKPTFSSMPVLGKIPWEVIHFGVFYSRSMRILWLKAFLTKLDLSPFLSVAMKRHPAHEKKLYWWPPPGL